MAVMPYATVVGVFKNRSAADLAMDALTNVGFQRTQMRCLVADSAGGFIDSLKSVFTGLTPVEETLVHNLTDMGLTDEEALYFSDEYTQGSAILAVKTQGDEEMALDILYRYGANNSREQARFGGVTPNESLSSPADNPTTDATNDALFSSQADEVAPVQDDQQDEAAQSINTEALYQSFPPMPFGYNLQAANIKEIFRRDQPASSPEEENDATPAESSPEQATDDYDISTHESSPEQATDDYEIVLVPSEFGETDDGEESEMPVYQTEQDDEEDAAPDYQQDAASVGSQSQEFTPSETQPASASPEWKPTDQTPQAETYEDQPYSDELRQLLAQVEETKQQLQEARARLEQARKHENLFSTTREQLKELQAELQATQAELAETQRRMVGEKSAV